MKEWGCLFLPNIDKDFATLVLRVLSHISNETQRYAVGLSIGSKQLEFASDSAHERKVEYQSVRQTILQN